MPTGPYLRDYSLFEDAPVVDELFAFLRCAVTDVDGAAAKCGRVDGRFRRDTAEVDGRREEDDGELVPSYGELDQGQGNRDDDVPGAQGTHRLLHQVHCTFVYKS